MVEGSLAHKLLISLPAAIEMLSERLPLKEAKTLLVKGLTEGEIELSSSKATFMLPYFSGHLSDDEKKNLTAELHAEFLEMMVEMSAPSDSNFDFGWTSKPSVGTFLLKTDYGADDFAHFEIHGAMVGLKSLNQSLKKHINANTNVGKPGRPKGSGEINDEALLHEARRLMTALGNRRSLHAILTDLASSVAGGHSVESTARRLRRKYNKAYVIENTST